VCLILAAVLVSFQVPLLPVWLTLCVLAMVGCPGPPFCWLTTDRPDRGVDRRPRPATQAPAISTSREPTIIDADQ